MKRKRPNNRELKDKILALRLQGDSYREIASKLDCSKSLISYHCNNGKTKSKLFKYNKSRDEDKKALIKKINNFKSRHLSSFITNKTSNFKRTTSSHKSIVNNINEGNYGCQDVLDKIGSSPKCYLTGKPIDLSASETYEFDHIVPIKLGGTNDLSNLQICLKEANNAKGSLMLDDFYKLCEEILEYRNSNNKLKTNK